MTTKSCSKGLLKVSALSNKISKMLSALSRMTISATCPICHRAIGAQEHYVCLHCLLHAPFTNLWLERDNAMEQRFWGFTRITRAASLLWYITDAGWERSLYEFKYFDCWSYGESLGKWMAAEFNKVGFFKDIDLIVPVPLHPFRLFERLYNQAELIAFGVSEYTGIKCDISAMSRIVNNPPQASLPFDERWENTENIFAVTHPERLKGRHILIVDDVFTSGATAISCAQTIRQACNDDVEISVITLFIAQKYNAE